tara:strand:- start:1168 stop:1566 length:399 start_codon:yes stop_codon:yes gene_type:complete
MSESLTIPIQAVDGPVSALILFFALAIGHSLADFPLQGDFLSRGKNRHVEPPKLADGKGSPKDLWIYLMTAHCLIHAGFVWVITGCVVLALAELVIHWLIDALKCEGRTSFAVDQWLHLLTKAVFVLLIWFY